MIKSWMYRKPGSSVRKCAKALNESKRFLRKDKKLSHQPVQNFIKTTTWGKTAFKSSCKPLLSAKNISDRPHHQNLRYRTEKRSDVPPTLIPKKGLKLMVAGGFSSRGVTDLHIVPAGQTVTGNYYRTQILPIYSKALDTKVLFPKKKLVTFQQDGAPAHTANATMHILDGWDITIWGKGVWPGNSPDLNPIENLWSILKDSVYEDPKPTTKDALIQRFKKSWKSISKTTLENLAHSFKKRIEPMMKANGGHTTY
ncbi:Transposable element Tc3 transposase [Folsomia candida]|uniref:Transposable element Tc3 transposase n=1 Tax=Folsomia candida TaxID=158441 RepID=A0A226CYM9_FOLCA|nr:Transposable element Tc3 transposase [Folsomia candida]